MRSPQYYFGDICLNTGTCLLITEKLALPPAGPRAEAVALLAEMGISQHLADLFLQQEITRDVAQAVERADLEGLLSEPDIQKFLRWQRVH